MRPVGDAGEFREALQRVKVGARSFTTNIYATPEAINGWIARGALLLEERQGSLLLLRRDQDFHHLYYAAPDGTSLDRALSDDAASWRGGTVTVDLVGREVDILPIVEAFRSAGFHRHASLTRMFRMADPAAPDTHDDPEVVKATSTDAPAVHDFLARLLDPYAEQLPEVDELRTAASRGGLLLVRRGADLGGILFFETTGLTSVLRYWFVNDRFRDQGIGARLIKTFFRTCQSSKRIVLWVISDNHDSIAKYQHYRFRPEGLVDHVMIRKGDRPA
jgi:RimJ/RimL family protein N-acetyltransferase